MVPNPSAQFSLKALLGMVFLIATVFGLIQKYGFLELLFYVWPNWKFRVPIVFAAISFLVACIAG
ncbi:MAG TPA: hypothetical protein VGX76_22545, partial [Pirellulales bacterium]|nr:hypothetical protein [Pirellulales bacterium]